MERNANRDVLKRMIALLLALAGWAESAASLPYPLRFILLKILRRAEIAGRNVVADEARYLRVAPWLMSSAEAHNGTSRAAAMSLALCFRLLALALANLSMLGRRSVPSGIGSMPRAAALEPASLVCRNGQGIRARDAPAVA